MSPFVVLHHELPSGQPRSSHWDFMIQRGDVLQTWALPRAPDAPGGMTAERLADHRLEYLHYEGPVSGGRGRVTRWDEGNYDEDLAGQAPRQLVLYGNRLVGLVVLTRPQNDHRHWRFEFFASRPAESD